MNAHEDVVQKQGWLKDEVRGAKGVDLRMHDSTTSWLEGVFARGDRRLGPVLLQAHERGARFDSWQDQLRIEVWEEAFRDHGIDPFSYLGTIPVTARLPWSHIDVGLEEGFLVREYRKALKSRLSPPCGKAAGMFIHHTNVTDAKADERKLVCYDCGVACDLSAMRKERVAYLDRLGAQVKREKILPVLQPAPAPAPAPDLLSEVAADGAAPAPAAPAKPKRRGPPPLVVQGDPRRFRFLFAKVGSMAFLSHLDLIRAFPRSFRRIDLPVFYSSGYNPKPDMMFSPALSLGVASLAEVLDIKLAADADPSELPELLSAASPEGLVWRGAAMLSPLDLPVSKVIDGARYAVGIPASALAPLGGEARLREEVLRVEASDDVRVIRRFDRGLAKAVDVKRFLRGVSVGDARAAAFLAEARVAGDLVPLLVDVDIAGDGAVKVSEVMEALFPKSEDGSEVLPFHAVRAELGLWHEGALVSPIALEAMRTLRPVPVRAPAKPAAEVTATAE